MVWPVNTMAQVRILFYLFSSPMREWESTFLCLRCLWRLILYIIHVSQAQGHVLGKLDAQSHVPSPSQQRTHPALFQAAGKCLPDQHALLASTASGLAGGRGQSLQQHQRADEQRLSVVRQPPVTCVALLSLAVKCYGKPSAADVH